MRSLFLRCNMMTLKYTSLKRTLTIGSLPLIFVFVLTTSCRDDDEGDRVPRIQTEITLNLNLPEYNILLNPGGWLYLTGGSRGIIVYRVNNDEFAAFDRHCTFNVPEACRVFVDENSGLTASDTLCCESIFEIITGNVVQGPAQFQLQPFQTQFNQNSDVLRIFN
jgi:nitrite reductase/ring-hydroxylating ferredoxin subunit